MSHEFDPSSERPERPYEQGENAIDQTPESQRFADDASVEREIDEVMEYMLSRIPHDQLWRVVQRLFTELGKDPKPW